MRKIISLLGKPCAGKGTRLRKFLEGKEDQYMIVSCGDVLRQEVEKKKKPYWASKPNIIWMRKTNTRLYNN